MADGGMQTLSADDIALVRDAIRERARLKREASELSDTKLAQKFGVPRIEIQKLRKGVAWARSVARVDFGPKPGTNCARILEVLREGPATSTEISATIGVPVRNIVSLLHGLEKRALVGSRDFETPDNLTHKTAKLYHLPGQRP